MWIYRVTCGVLKILKRVEVVGRGPKGLPILKATWIMIPSCRSKSKDVRSKVISVKLLGVCFAAEATGRPGPIPSRKLKFSYLSSPCSNGFWRCWDVRRSLWLCNISNSSVWGSLFANAKPLRRHLLQIIMMQSALMMSLDDVGPCN